MYRTAAPAFKTAACPQSIILFKVLFSQQKTVISLNNTLPLGFFFNGDAVCIPCLPTETELIATATHPTACTVFFHLGTTVGFNPTWSVDVFTCVCVFLCCVSRSFTTGRAPAKASYRMFSHIVHKLWKRKALRRWNGNRNICHFVLGLQVSLVIVVCVGRIRVGVYLNFI